MAEIIRDRQARDARAKGSEVPLLLDPKLILEYIDLWHKDPNTPLPDFNITPGQSYMLTAFIGEEKWKYEKDRQVKKAQYKKECFLKKNVVKMSPEELVTMQTEIKALSDEFDAYRADWLGAKVRFVKLAKGFTPNVAAFHRNMKFLRLRYLLSLLKNMQAQLMKIRLLKKMRARGLLKKF